MKLTILIPTEEYKANAGARIRYGRILHELEECGLTVALEDVSKFDPRKANCDLMLVSKCHDARSLVAAEILSQRGVRIGVDLFDDYFSQLADSPLARFRNWLRQMLERSDFAICSTVAMEQVIGAFSPSCPVHILSDPAPPVDQRRLSAILNSKRGEMCASGRARLAWFGVGDNPHFPVGLSDLSAFSGKLRWIASRGIAIHLSILTNARALDAARLALIADLPVGKVTVDEWSEEAEAELLRNAFAAFLPVNAQSFSAAKSLNRAVTALTAGCQVLTAGYPLYGKLAPLIYDKIDEFAEDVRRGQLRMRPDRLDTFAAKIEQLASAQREADALVSFLRSLDPKVRDGPSPIYLVNGVATNGTAHKMVQAVGGLSVATPFCGAPLSFDVVFENRPGRDVAMLVSDKALARLQPSIQRRATPYGSLAERNFWEVSAGGASDDGETPLANASLPLQLALYPSMMRSVLAALDEGFGPGAAIISENSPLPFIYA